MIRAAILVLAALAGLACGSRGDRATSAESARERGPRVEDAFDGPPDLLVVVRPARLGRDPLYGPLLRRASQLASAHVGLATSAGTTAFAAIERAEEVVVGVYDRQANDAVVAVRGVPADVDPAHIVDTDGRPLWVVKRELPGGVTELGPSDGSSAALFALPRRSWIIAAGAAALRARAAYVEGARGVDGAIDAVDDGPLVVARLRGDALVRARPELAEGPLSSVVEGLAFVSASLEPGPEGQVGEVALRFVYGDEGTASAAESTVRDVVAALMHRFESTAPWLAAIAVSRAERAVVVRGRIPRAWADGLLHLDLDAPP